MRGLFRRGTTWALLAILATSVAACSDNPAVDPAPDPTLISEPPFTGTLTVNGAQSFSFATTMSGAVTATIGKLDPSNDGALSVGLSLGVWNGSTCQLVISNLNAGIGAGALGSASGAGNLCVHIQDIGQLTQPVAFSIDVTHF